MTHNTSNHQISTFSVAFCIFVIGGDTNYKFGAYVDHTKCQPIDKLPLKDARSINQSINQSINFWANHGPVLSDHCPVCLSVCPFCNVSVLWPNCWIDQDATWYGDRPRPRPHCVRWGPRSPHGKGHSIPHFSGSRTSP